MTPIPRAAMAVVRVLRRDVKRPKRLPKDATWTGKLRWRGWRGCPKAVCCPMGLHSQSRCEAPMWGVSFAAGKCDDNAVYLFAMWWDSIPASDARAAVDAVWPKKRKAKR